MSEVEAQLREELENLKQRFADWKVRAKTSVDKERERFIELSQQNDLLVRKCDELQTVTEGLRKNEDLHQSELSQMKEELEALREKAVDIASTKEISAELEKTSKNVIILEEKLTTAHRIMESDALMFEILSKSVVSTFSFLFDEGVELMSVKHSVYDDSVTKVYSASVAALVTSVAEANANLDRHKRNVERAMKLASREQDGAKAELDGLRSTVAELEEELATARNGVKQRDIAIAALEQRLEEAISSLSRYETDTVTSANQGHYINELEQRVSEMEREFSDRELILHDQHRDEIDRLMQNQEIEVNQIRSSLEDQLRDLAFELNEARNKAAVVQSGFVMGTDDTAYNELLEENSSLREQLQEVSRYRGELQRELGALKEKLSRFEVPPTVVYTSSGSGRSHIDTSQMDPQLMRRKIYDLETQISTLSEQVVQLNQELIEHKASSKERAGQTQASANSGLDSNGCSSGMTANQHNQYTRAILVKMLCANSDDVCSSLLPVVSSLVKFSNDELKAIYSANPTWVH